MSDNLMPHHPEEIHLAFMQNDIKRWKEEIETVNAELNFFRNLINSHSKEVATWNQADYRNLFAGISEAKLNNKAFQKMFRSFSNKLERMHECDDLECETYFLNDHAAFKTEIEGHFSSYRRFKKTMFSYLKTKYNY